MTYLLITMLDRYTMLTYPPMYSSRERVRKDTSLKLIIFTLLYKKVLSYLLLLKGNNIRRKHKMLEKEDYQNLCSIVKEYTNMEKYELNEKQRSDETASLRDMASRVYAIEPADLQEEAINTVDKYLELRGKGTAYFSLIFRNFVRELDELAEYVKENRNI